MADQRLASRASTWLTDFAVAAGLTVVVVLAAVHIEAEPGERPRDWLAVTLVVVAAISMALRRRLPLVTLAVVGVALFVYAARDHPGGPVYALGPLALFSFMVTTTRRLALTAAGALLAAMIAARWAGGHAPDGITLLWVGWVVAATLGSEVARGRIEQRRLAEQQRREALERTAETLRRQQVEERLRIARDLHDSVAHTMATINVQAGVAAHVIERQPREARAALEVIRATSGEVLDELAAMLTLLRADTGAQGPDGTTDLHAPRQPVADLTRLDSLVDSSRLAGLDVELVVGDVRLDAVPATIGTSAYRIIQEALTNVIRHAETDQATVAVLRTPGGALAIEVRDEGVGSAASNGEAQGSGMGLVGIRERAEATGGLAEIGPRAGGGFLVRVTWPG